MTTATWNGSTGNFFNPRNWTPHVVPAAFSDVAVISSGKVLAGGEDIASNILLGSKNPIHDAELSLNNVTLDGQPLSVAPPGDTVGNYYGDLDIAGTVDSTFVIGAGSGGGQDGNLDVRIAANAKFENNGIIVSEPGSIITIAGHHDSVLVNNLVPVVDEESSIDADGGRIVIDAKVIGNGETFVDNRTLSGSLGLGSVTFVGPVSSGQHVSVATLAENPAFAGSGYGRGGLLTIDDPTQFLASIDIGPGGQVRLSGLHETSHTYRGGVLTVYDHRDVVATLHIATDDGAVLGVRNAAHGVVISATTSTTHQPFSAMIVPHLS